MGFKMGIGRRSPSGNGGYGNLCISNLMALLRREMVGTT